MESSRTTTESAFPPEAPGEDEGDITQPLRIISSRTPHAGIPRRRRGSWFKKPDRSDARRTPDFIEIGDPAA